VAVGTPIPTNARRIDVLLAANDALARGNAPQAASLYERVANTPAAADETATGAMMVSDFAHFRAMVALLAAGQEDDAREQLDMMTERDATAPLTRLGSQVWDQYGMTGSVRSACAQAKPQFASEAGPVVTALQGLGVDLDANNLCGMR
jgi:hypothetical protein